MSDNKNRGLGMGIATLLGGHNNPYISSSSNDFSNSARILEIDIDNIITNPDQPRKIFNQEKLQELSNSISLNGILQPILVTTADQDGKYTIIAGERRYKASKMANLKTIKAIVMNLNQKEILRNAIIENIQREDLNPLEEAVGYRNMIDTFGYTHESLATELGKSRSHISNLLRILSLPDNILLGLRNNSISFGHAKLLLSVDDPEYFFDIIQKNNLSVRNLEKEIHKSLNKKTFLNHNKQNDDEKNDPTSPVDITYEMIKKLYQPFTENDDEVSEDIQASTIENVQNDDEINQNVKSIEQYISEYSELDVKIDVNALNMEGCVKINFKDAQDLMNIVNKLFFNKD